MGCAAASAPRGSSLPCDDLLRGSAICVAPFALLGNSWRHSAPTKDPRSPGRHGPDHSGRCPGRGPGSTRRQRSTRCRAGPAGRRPDARRRAHQEDSVGPRRRGLQGRPGRQHDDRRRPVHPGRRPDERHAVRPAEPRSRSTRRPGWSARRSTRPSTAQVQQLLPGPTPDTVYVAGDFTKINNKGPNHIQLLNVNTGQAVTSFKAPSTNGGIETMELLPNNRLFIGGFFNKIGGVDPRPARHAQRHHRRARPVHGPRRCRATTTPAPAPRRRSARASPALTPAGDRMVVVGNFRTVGGLARDQIVMIDLTGATAAVATDLVHHAATRRSAPPARSTATCATSRCRPTAPSSSSPPPAARTAARCATPPRASRPTPSAPR